jgi:hypothetical protein
MDGIFTHVYFKHLALCGEECGIRHSSCIIVENKISLFKYICTYIHIQCIRDFSVPTPSRCMTT